MSTQNWGALQEWLSIQDILEKPVVMPKGPPEGTPPKSQEIDERNERKEAKKDKKELKEEKESKIGEDKENEKDEKR